MKILKTPWKKELLDLIKNSKENIRITSPFIKENICNEIIIAKQEKSKINLITSFKLFNLYSGSLDINGLDKLIKNSSIVKNNSKLHAKIYLFDEKYAIISSGNLTNGGLINNYEYGLLIDERAIINKIINDFELLYNDENTGLIKSSDILTVRKILSKIPKTSAIKIPKYSFESSIDEEIIETKADIISNNLTGWKKEVFLVINVFDKQIFDLKDVYKFESKLAKIYPENNNIKDKIRQQLQILRDLGLIEFLGHGKYKRLWREKQ